MHIPFLVGLRRGRRDGGELGWLLGDDGGGRGWSGKGMLLDEPGRRL